MDKKEILETVKYVEEKIKELKKEVENNNFSVASIICEDIEETLCASRQEFDDFDD